MVWPEVAQKSQQGLYCGETQWVKVRPSTALSLFEFVCLSCFQLRVIRAFRSYLEDLEEKRSIYTSLRSHTLPRAAASLLSQDRRRSDNHINLIKEFNKTHSPNDGYSVENNHLSVPSQKARRHSCEYIWWWRSLWPPFCYSGLSQTWAVHKIGFLSLGLSSSLKLVIHESKWFLSPFGA